MSALAATVCFWNLLKVPHGRDGNGSSLTNNESLDWLPPIYCLLAVVPMNPRGSHVSPYMSAVHGDFLRRPSQSSCRI